MDNVGRVHEVHGAEHAVEDGDHVVLGEVQFWDGLEHLLHVCLDKLHDDEKVGFTVALSGGDDIIDLGHVLVVWHLGEVSEDLDFPDNLLEVILIFEDVFD